MHATGLMASNFKICSDIYYVDAFWSKRKHDLDACVGRRGGSWSLAAEIHPRRKKSQTQYRTEIRFEVFLVSLGYARRTLGLLVHAATPRDAAVADFILYYIYITKDCLGACSSHCSPTCFTCGSNACHPTSTAWTTCKSVLAPSPPLPAANVVTHP